MIEREYISKNHSKFLIKYHIIFVCKYRRRILTGDIETSMKQILLNIAELSDFNIEVMESNKDHMHMMVSSEPKVSPLQIVRRLKQMSTTAIWKRQGELLHRIFWKENTFWTNGYFVASVGNVSQETIKRYIENLG